MKTIFFILLFITLIQASENNIVINNQNYKLTKEKYKEYGDEGLLLSFYKREQSQPFLSFLLTQRFGGCGKSNYEEAAYEINGSKISIYTKWHGYSMSGYRKMVYDFDTNNSKAKKLSCKFYINNQDDYHRNSGVIYLSKKPQDEEEKQLLQEYISSMEGIYKGEFVLDDEAKKLSDEVNSALVKSMKQKWGS